MKTKTTTREYDDQGRMVRETIVEQDTASTVYPTNCTCWAGGGYCASHGYWHGPGRVTTSPTITPMTTPSTTTKASITINGVRRDVASWIIEDLTEQESDAFIAALDPPAQT